jgi:hypothetical protein
MVDSNAELIDIRTITIDKDMSKHERIIEFIRQINDPYHFKCGKFTVTVQFTEDGPSLEDCLHRLMS